jgi:hypothetical protein
VLARPALGGSVGSVQNPALLGWGLRVTVCVGSVSVWVGPL